jgi:hypothetical protein
MKPLRLLVPTLLAFGLALVVTAPPARAQGGLNLYWDDCSLAGTLNKTFACNTNTGPPLTMVVSVVPTVDVPQLVGAEVRVFSMVSSIHLPSWWQTLASQCRAGAIGASFDPAVMPANNCLPVWGDNTPLTAVTLRQDIDRSSFEIRVAGAIALPIAVTGDATELIVGLIRITRAASTGTGSCAGCLNGACFLLESVTLVQPDGVGNYTFQVPATSNWTTYNGGGSLPYQCYVPTQNRTWGQIKSLYH